MTDHLNKYDEVKSLW